MQNKNQRKLPQLWHTRYLTLLNFIDLKFPANRIHIPLII